MRKYSKGGGTPEQIWQRLDIALPVLAHRQTRALPKHATQVDQGVVAAEIGQGGVADAGVPQKLLDAFETDGVDFVQDRMAHRAGVAQVRQTSAAAKFGDDVKRTDSLAGMAADERDRGPAQVRISSPSFW